jgi:hypothetical protein
LGRPQLAYFATGDIQTLEIRFDSLDIDPRGQPMGQFHVILIMPSYGLIPVPPHLRHLTILSPFLRVPFPSQFLHFCFFCPVFFRTHSSKVDRRSSPTFFKRSLAVGPLASEMATLPLVLRRTSAFASWHF